MKQVSYTMYANIGASRIRMWLVLVIALSFISACSSSSSDSPFFLPPSALSSGSSGFSCPATVWPFMNAYLADTVTEASGEQPNWAFGNSLCAANGIYGAGANSGSTDVYSLRSSATATKCESNEKCITLEWKGYRVKNTAGTDFVVFENPFNRSDSSRFIEAVIVEVSADGSAWCGWSPAYTGEKDKANTNFATDIYDATKYQDVAGLEPVLFNQSNWPHSAADIFDRSKAGGDHFDLSSLSFGNGTNCDAGLKADLQTNGFVYIRLTTANSRNSTDFPLPGDSFDQTADIDGVVARVVEAR